MCIILYRHCPGCYGMKNNRRRVEFCPKVCMARNGWIPGRNPRKSDEKPCKKALHYQEEQWKKETYKSHKHIPGLKGKLPPEESILVFSGRMADLKIRPSLSSHSNEKDQNKKPSKEEWMKCLETLAFPTCFSSPQPERPIEQGRQEIKTPPQRIYSRHGLITPPYDANGFNPVIPSDLEQWPELPVSAEGADEHYPELFADLNDHGSESEVSGPTLTPGSRPMSPPPSPPSRLASTTPPPMTKKRARRPAKALNLGTKMLKRTFENAKKAYETRSKRMIKRKVKK